MKDDKIKPITERIAEMFGRGAGFCDLRGGKPEVTSADIARALGNIASEHGNLVPMVLETKYASTLIHERSLCEAWEIFAKKSDPTMDKETVSFSRHACTLYIRELASGRKTRSDITAHVAWLLGVRRVSLEGAIWLIGSWFDDLVKIGEDALRKQFKSAA
jgi:hypothetical protein